MKTLIKTLLVFLYIDIVTYFGTAFHQLQWNPLLWSSDARVFPTIVSAFTVFILLVMAGGEMQMFSDKKK